MQKMMLWLLLLNAAEVNKKGGDRKIDAFRIKLMISDAETSECPEHEIKSNIRNI